MLGNLLGGLVNKEKMTHDTIQETLHSISEELDCSEKDFFVMIKPVDSDFNMKFYIYKLEKGVPKLIREITLKEILGEDG